MAKFLDKWLRGTADSTLIQFVRYTFVGGAAFVVDFAALWALTDLLQIHYLWSAAFAFLLGLVTNYCLSIAWVFNKRAVGNRWTEFAVFALLGIAGLGLNEGMMYFLPGVLGAHYLVSKIGATGLTYLWNFFSRKLLLFSAQRRSNKLTGASFNEARPSMTRPAADQGQFESSSIATLS
jgi:putative flippase GtrA